MFSLHVNVLSVGGSENTPDVFIKVAAHVLNRLLTLETAILQPSGTISDFFFFLLQIETLIDV